MGLIPCREAVAHGIPKLFFMKKILDKLFSTSAAGLYMILFAVSIGAATFIENDFGTSSAQKVVYRAWWFELLLLLFCGAIVFNIFRYRMVQMKKWAILTFHLSILVILAGAGIIGLATHGWRLMDLLWLVSLMGFGLTSGMLYVHKLKVALLPLQHIGHA